MKSKFIKVKCNGCNNEQTIFGKSSQKIACLVCNETLGTSTGGKTKVFAKVLEVLE